MMVGFGVVVFITNRYRNNKLEYISALSVHSQPVSILIESRLSL